MRSTNDYLPRKWSFLATFFAFLCSSVAMADTASLNIVGTAYSVKTGTLLYRETHQKINENDYKVEYSEPDGRIFGHKIIDFSQSAMTPSFSQRNERNGESIEVEQSNGNVISTYQESSTAKKETGSVKLAAGMVVDAGFDAFIKQYWDALVAGKKMQVDYLVPSKLTTFAFQFSQAACVEGTEDGAQCFSFIPVSWLVKLAVDPIVVAYDPIKKNLLRFTGRANICDVQGKYENVDIHYHYF